MNVSQHRLEAQTKIKVALRKRALLFYVRRERNKNDV